MMKPKDTLHNAIDEYLRGARTLHDLFRWLTSHADEVERDTSVRDDAGTAWLLISEFDAGDRDEQSVREELQALRVAA